MRAKIFFLRVSREINSPAFEFDVYVSCDALDIAKILHSSEVFVSGKIGNWYGFNYAASINSCHVKYQKT